MYLMSRRQRCLRLFLCMKEAGEANIRIGSIVDSLIVEWFEGREPSQEMGWEEDRYLALIGLPPLIKMKNACIVGLL
jgi:hypothetical protein